MSFLISSVSPLFTCPLTILWATEFEEWPVSGWSVLSSWPVVQCVPSATYLALPGQATPQSSPPACLWVFDITSVLAPDRPAGVYHGVGTTQEVRAFEKAEPQGLFLTMWPMTPVLVPGTARERVLRRIKITLLALPNTPISLEKHI